MTVHSSSKRSLRIWITYWIPAAALLGLTFQAVLRAHSIEVAIVLDVLCAGILAAAVYSLMAKQVTAVRSKYRGHALLRAMATASRQAFFFCGPVRDETGSLTNLQVRYANASALKTLGLSRRQARNESLLQFTEPATHASFLQQCATVLESGQAAEIQLSLTSRKGVSEFYQLRLTPLADGIAISALQSLEEQAAHRRIDELNKFTQSVFETAPVSIIALSATGAILAMNNAAEQLTLYRGHELIGLHSILLLHDPAEVSARAVELNEQTGKPVRAGFESLLAMLGEPAPEREWSYIRRDGTKVWVSLSLSLLRTHEGDSTGYLAVAFDVTERKRLCDAANHMAQHDQLTGLLNRSLLEDRLQHGIDRAHRLKDNLAVFLIDIDHFKRINDSLGHSGGDAVLTTVAARLTGAVRSSDTVVRVGGDEFVVILPHLQGQESADHRAETLLENISAPFFVGNREIRVTASIGYCLYPDGADNVASLLKKADLAMYSAKTAGRSAYRAFSNELQRETTDRLEMEEDLRHAIERGEFAPHYQPQVNSVSGEVIGVEMLLRWNNSKRGNVPPDVFLPVAEEAGLMSRIGEWGLRRACMDCVTAQSRLGKRLRVAVNLSSREFQNGSLPSIVKDALLTSHLPAADLELEITEQMLMCATPCLLENLEAIRNMGVSLAIDDFGTGFSNFSYILQYNVDRLKIDRSFIGRAVRDAGAAAVVNSIIAMAHGLGMKVCAEGVETREQLDFLKRRACDEVQGFLYSRAVALEQLTSVVVGIDNSMEVALGPVLIMPHTAMGLPSTEANCA